MLPTGAYTYATLHSPKGVLHIYQYITVSAYGTYTLPLLNEALPHSTQVAIQLPTELF
jgi:hypothetical protein